MCTPAVRVERDSQPPSARSVVRHQSSASMVLAADDPDAPDVHLASLRSYEGGDDHYHPGGGSPSQLTRSPTPQQRQRQPAGAFQGPVGHPTAQALSGTKTECLRRGQPPCKPDTAQHHRMRALVLPR